MTDLVVIFAVRTGLAVGALTTVPVSVPALPASLVLDLPFTPKKAAPPYRTLRFRGDELSAAALDAEFTGPLTVFDWRVESTRGPDGQVRRTLQRLIDGPVPRRTGTRLTVTAKRLGTAGLVEELPVEVRSRDALVATGAIRIDAAGASGRTTVPLPAGLKASLVVLVQGYRPVVS